MRNKPLLTLALVAIGLVAAHAEPTLKGPYTHKNVQVYLIEAPSTLSAVDGEILTLQEALKRKAVVVHETGEVNQLKVENTSNHYVYIHAGDIIKGGKQDRTLPNSFTLAPNSKPVPVDSFCVESGRWRQRSGESAARFSGSSKVLNSKNLKLAARYAKSQGAVWQNVAVEQGKLSEKAGKDVRSATSATSLQLTLEDKDIEKLTTEYEKAISEAVAQQLPTASGVAIAINGEFNSAEVFGSPALFAKLWPKLLEGIATESVAEFDEKLNIKALDADAILAAMKEAESAEANEQKLAASNSVVTRDGKDNVILDVETDFPTGKLLVHRAVLAKGDFQAAPAGDLQQRMQVEQTLNQAPNPPAQLQQTQAPEPQQRRGFIGRLFRGQ